MTIDPRPIINSAVMVEPHDVLIIALANSTTAVEVERISKTFGDEMPGIRIAVIDNVAALGVVKAAARVATEMGS